MRICIVYDCLYPYTVGGAERWYRSLAERLAADGHEVTYVTLRQWGNVDRAAVPGVRVVAVGSQMSLYVHGRRRILPPLIFGFGTLRHLLVHRRRYDVVHTASFPYFSLLAAAVARPFAGFRLVVDWHEVWTPEYWREYLGPLGGTLGWGVQFLCLQIRQSAFCFSRLHEERIRANARRIELTRLEGEYAGTVVGASPRPAEPVVVFAGRHIQEKRVVALVPAIARAKELIPELRCEIYGDGPERVRVLASIEAHGLADSVTAPGFVDGEHVEHAIRRALCIVLPSRREGYGLVVVEAAALATPSVVVSGPDNAATELVDDGENGVLAASASPEDLAAAIVRINSAGYELRVSTAAWFARSADRLSLDRSLQTISAVYAGEDNARS